MAFRVASINLNKRVSNERWHSQVLAWLADQKVDLVLTQEPAKANHLIPRQLGSFVAVGGNSRVFVWRHDGLQVPIRMETGEYWQILRVNDLTLCSIYLDSKAPKARAAQLYDLLTMLAVVSAPLIISGDFNIAPTPEDGRYGGAASPFNNETDRAPLRHLIQELQLVDKRSDFGRRDYTVVRSQLGKLVQFRCDLALVSRSIEAYVQLSYDHLVRDPAVGFTDHSALVLDIQIP